MSETSKQEIHGIITTGICCCLFYFQCIRAFYSYAATLCFICVLKFIVFILISTFALFQLLLLFILWHKQQKWCVCAFLLILMPEYSQTYIHTFKPFILTCTCTCMHVWVNAFNTACGNNCCKYNKTDMLQTYPWPMCSSNTVHTGV